MYTVLNTIAARRRRITSHDRAMFSGQGHPSIIGSFLMYEAIVSGYCFSKYIYDRMDGYIRWLTVRNI